MIYVRTIDYSSQNFGLILLSYLPAIPIFAYPIGVTLFLFLFKEQLSEPKVKRSFGAFYQQIDLEKGRLALAYHPLTLFRRLIFALIPKVFFAYPWMQIILLLVINFVFTFYYLEVRPHTGPKMLYYREAHNEIMILVLSYLIFIFTDFVKYGQDGSLISGYVFVACIVEIFIVNIGFIFYGYGRSTAKAVAKRIL